MGEPKKSTDRPLNRRATDSREPRLPKVGREAESLTVGAWLAALDGPRSGSGAASRRASCDEPFDDLLHLLRAVARGHGRLRRRSADDVEQLVVETAEDLFFDAYLPFRKAPSDEPLVRALGRAIERTLRVRRLSEAKLRKALAAEAERERVLRPRVGDDGTARSERDALDVARCSALVAEVRRALTPHEFRVLVAASRSTSWARAAKRLRTTIGAVCGAMHSARRRAAHLAPPRPAPRDQNHDSRSSS